MGGSPIAFVMGVGVVVIALLAACGGEGETRSGLRQALPTEIDIEHVRANASEQQLVLLSDGIVDFSDLERATLSFITCLEDVGFVVKSTPVYDETKLRFQFVLGPPGNNPEAGAEDLSRCMRRELAFVGEAWEAQHQATQAERDNALEVLRTCLRNVGEEELANTITEDQIASLLGDPSVGQELARCVTEVVSETGVRLD